MDITPSILKENEYITLEEVNFLKKKYSVLMILGLAIIALVALGFRLINNKNKDDGKNKITLGEVTHSVFYAPLYVAIEEGYFDDENIDLELVLTSGADKVSAAVLSGDVQIGFAGAESAIYVYDKGEKDYLQIFSGLTKRDGQFILGRENIKDFTLEDLKGKEILVGRSSGMPALNFLNALKNANIDPEDININYSVDFSALSGSFIGGEGDYVNLFEPNCRALEKEGNGFVLASIGKLSGEMPYTTFYARKSYIKENEDIIKAFTKAINKGLKFVKENDSQKIAEAIIDQFPDTSVEDLTTIVERYKAADSWLDNSFVAEDLLQNLEDIMIDNDLLDKYVSYKDLVINYE